MNTRFKELAGEDCPAKDLRTWTATVLAATAFAAAGQPKSKAAAKRREREVIREVAEALGNTPAACRRSYVDPRVIAAFHNGQTIARVTRGRGESGDPSSGKTSGPRLRRRRGWRARRTRPACR
ncbi:hypothetical protein [Amycolatopsis pithecellobii]|uniref:hypothetical protein n=1 Tax=Amycolatopsis pithecellobii TaxID=664692 RepID=UPI0035E45E8C